MTQKAKVKTKAKAKVKRPRKRAELTIKKKAVFLEHVIEGFSISDACKAIKVARRTPYDWRELDADFAEAWDEAVDIGNGALEDEAMRRGVKGVDEPVYYKGQPVGHIKRYSDTLLIFLMKGRMPEKYGDKFRHEHKHDFADAEDTLDKKLAALATANGAGEIPQESE